MRIDCVLDTSAAMAVFRGEPGADKADPMLAGGGCVMHAANMCEFCFSAPKKSGGLITSDWAMAWLDRNGIDGIDWMDRHFVLLAADVRAAAPALSLGDGLAVALAAALGVPVLTTEPAFLEAGKFAAVELIRKPAKRPS